MFQAWAKGVFGSWVVGGSTHRLGQVCLCVWAKFCRFSFGSSLLMVNTSNVLN